MTRNLRPLVVHTYPISKGHLTDGRPCWCDPKTVKYPNGASQVIHNDLKTC